MNPIPPGGIGGTAPANQFASPDPKKNIKYSTIVAANGILPTRFNGMTIEVKYAVAYEDQPDNIIHQPVNQILGTDYGDSPINWYGAFTMGGSKDVNLGTAYRDFLDALAKGTIDALLHWFNSVTDGSSNANFFNFQNAIGLQENVYVLIKQLMRKAAEDLPNAV